jgi:hypothetical protein
MPRLVGSAIHQSTSDSHMALSPIAQAGIDESVSVITRDPQPLLAGHPAYSA